MSTYVIATQSKRALPRECATGGIKCKRSIWNAGILGCILFELLCTHYNAGVFMKNTDP
jgi:hypothetical protein